MIDKQKRIHTQEGFTLVELLVALVLSGLVIWMVYSTYIVQQRTNTGQQAVSEMQQNIRAALVMMTTEMKMAGLDPREHSGAGITLAAAGRFSFTLDLFDDSGNRSPDDDVNDANEQISYGFSQAADANDDGVPDLANAVLNLGRNVGGVGGSGYQPIAENVERLEFFYTLVGGATSLNVTPANYKNIISVKISLLVRTSRKDPSFNNMLLYNSASGANWGPFNDGYRRRLLITEVNLRNMPK